MYSLAFSSQQVNEQIKADGLEKWHKDSNSVRCACTKAKVSSSLAF